MISERYVKTYCKEDISLIENYDIAVNDKTRKWVVHHRGEILPCGVYSRKDLQKFGLYWKRPASELIFITRAYHNVLHHKGKHHSEDTKKKISKSKMGNHYKPTQPILQYTIDGDFICQWPSITEIERTLNISHSNIIAVCSGRYQQAGGYIWKYA